MFDTTTTSLGIGVTGTDHPSSNLYITGNAYVSSNIAVGGVLTMGTVNVVARHDLESVTATGNTTPLTVEFRNADTSLVASGNVEVAKELTVTGNTTLSSNLTVSGNVEVGTANLFVDTVNSRVGIETAAPDATLHVVGNAYVSSDLIVDSEVRGRYDTDTTSYFGRAAVGYCGHIDAMSISHIDSNDTGGYALLQEANGGTILNSASGQPVRLRQGNVDKLTIDSNGNIGVGTSTPDKKLHVYTTSSESNSQLHLQSADRYSTIQMLDDTGAILFGNDRGAMRFITGYDTSYSGGSEAMRILGNGNVGVGTTGPSYPLDVQYTGDSGIRSKNIGTSHASVYIDSASGYSYLRFESSGAAKFWIQSTPTGDLAFRPSGGGHVVDIKNDGKVGIGRTDPGQTLDVFGRIGLCNTTSGKTHQRWHVSGGTDANYGNFYTVYEASGYTATWRTRVQGSQGNQATLNFTGQHKTYIKDISSERAEELEGLIVSANTNKYMKMSEGVEVGQNAITINESLPIVNISNVSQDKTCFGVISASEDPENVRGETIGCFTAFIHKEDGDTRVHINSVGEGALWVVNTNGPIESGDYITSSNIAGYGMKQESECLMNYTVAKSTMDCDFNPLTQKKRRIVKEERDAVAWVLRKYEEVSEEEYNNTPEDKRKIEDDTFKIEREYVSRHDLDNEDYIKETRTFEFSVLDENKQLVWEDTDETELEYKIRYLDANGNITTEENAIHKAAFIGCTYHCG